MLRIGDFARIAGVTVKALRHYDAIGLLRPAWVGGGAGYRYYAPEQIETLARIQELKSLGFALADIRRLLRRPPDLAAAIGERRAALLSDIDAAQDQLRRLDAFVAGLQQPSEPPAIQVRAVAPVIALCARALIEPGDGVVTRLFEDLEAHAAREKVRADASPFLLFHDLRRSDRLDVEACIPVRRAAIELAAAREVEGHARCGAVIYRGPYARTPALLSALAHWVDAHGGVIGGPIREIYHRFGAEQRGYTLPRRVLASHPDDYLTEIQAPIAREVQ
jgi:DNA-binding transcriptional MerR regulator